MLSRRAPRRPDRRPRHTRRLLPTLASVATLVTLVAAVALAVALLFAARTVALAHEVPARVALTLFVKPDGRTLHVVVRAPLEAMRDLRLPLRAGTYLDLSAEAAPALQAQLRDAALLWIAGGLDVTADDERLPAPRLVAARVSLPSDRSFARYESAAAHTAGAGGDGGALPADAALPWQQALLDVALDYPIANEHARFSIRPTLARLGLQTTTVLRFLPAGGAERALQYSGDPGLVRLDPRWYQAAASFVALGVEHILDGIDHLLFVLCLVLPIRRLRPLVGVVTAFTAAHSITLAASAAGFAPTALWFPPFVEVLVAASIVYMAFENIAGARLDRRWVVAFAFGLVHGFAFSFALQESMQFAGGHLATALVAFNAGVELGQLAVIAVAVPVLTLLFKRVVAERMGIILGSALVAHTAWHWLAERFDVLRGYRFTWPAFDGTLLAGVARGAVLLAVVVLTLWGLSALADRLARGRGQEANA